MMRRFAHHLALRGTRSAATRRMATNTRDTLALSYQHTYHGSLLSKLQTYVSGVANLRPHHGSGIVTASNVDPQKKSVWFAPPVEDIKNLMYHIGSSAESHIFVKSPIGSGKSSLIAFLQDALKEEAVVVRYNPDMMDKRFPENMAEVWSGGKWHTVKLSVVEMKEKALIIDEAHLWFNDAPSVQKQIKDLQGAKYVMLFSSTAAHQVCQSNTLNLASPACITHKPFLRLAFTKTDAEDLCKEFLLPQCEKILTQFDVQVTVTQQQKEWLLNFAAQLHALCDGNRIIMAGAVEYIRIELKSETLRNERTLPGASMVTLSSKKRSPDVLYQWAMRLLSCFLSQQQLSPTNRAMFINSGFQTIENAINWCNVLLANGSVHEDKCKNTIGTVLYPRCDGTHWG